MKEAVLWVRDGLQRGIFRREADTSAAVKRVLAALGWDVFDPEMIRGEFPIGRRRADIALMDPRGKPVVLVEVKDVGKADDKGEDQLFAYCFREGVSIAVLTDCRQWKLYFPTGRGRYRDRCFSDLDFVRGDPASIAASLSRYVGRDAVLSGEAWDAANQAWDAEQRRRDAVAAFPAVWNAMLRKPDAALVDLIRERVQQRVDVWLDSQDVARLLRGATAFEPIPEPDSPKRVPTPSPVRVPDPSPPDGPFLTFLGETKQFRRGVDVLVAAFERFANRDPSFCERFAAKHQGRSRSYVARQRDELYGEAPALTHAYAAELPGDWWLGTHSSNAQKLQRIRQACEVAGVQYGVDVVAHIPTRKRTTESGRSEAPHAPSRKAAPRTDPGRRETPVSQGAGKFTVAAGGETRRFGTAKDAFVFAFEWFAGRDPTFLERFAVKAKGRTVNPVAKDPLGLYTNRPERGRSASERLPGGWWIATHNNSLKKESLIRQACELAGLRYGEDVQVDFPVRHRRATGAPEPTAEASPDETRDAVKRRDQRR